MLLVPACLEQASASLLCGLVSNPATILFQMHLYGGI